MTSTASTHCGDVRSPFGQTTSGLGLLTRAQAGDPMTRSPDAPRRPAGCAMLGVTRTTAYWCARVQPPLGGPTTRAFAAGSKVGFRLPTIAVAGPDDAGSASSSVTSMTTTIWPLTVDGSSAPVTSACAVDSNGNAVKLPR